MIKKLARKIVEGTPAIRDEINQLINLDDSRSSEIIDQANWIREQVRGNEVDLCAIVSAKTGACQEDCTYCAQSSRAESSLTVTPLMHEDEIVERAGRARQSGARRFCIVTSGRRSTPKELDQIGRVITKIRSLGLLPCATLGLLDESQLAALKSAGLERYHHNLETSRRYFPEICTTHTYDDKLQTIRAAKSVGLSVCSGGIFGLGESWADRVDMAMDIRELGADSVPVNYLVPVPGTPLGGRDTLSRNEALKIIGIMRFVLPAQEIRICGGRLQVLGQESGDALMAGADGLLTGDCLTVAGLDPDQDIKMIKKFGLKVKV